MPTYSTGDLRGLQIIDPVLSNLARMYRPAGFLYERVASAFPVAQNVGQYPIFDQTYFFGDEIDNEVADRAMTPEIDLKYSTDRYFAKDYRLQTTISLRERQQAHPALRLEFAKTTALLSRMAIRREVRLANALRAVANGGQLTQAPITPAVRWDAGTSGTPATIEKDIKTALLAVYNQIGQVPNAIVLPWEVAWAIAVDPTILDILKYTHGEDILRDGDLVLPGTLFGLRVLIAKGTLRNTAREGAASAMTGIWGKSARLVYIDDNPQWGNPATVYAFRGMIRGDAGPPPGPTTQPGDETSSGGFALVDRWMTPDPPVDHIRAWETVDEKVVAPDLGVEIQSVIS